MRIALVTTTIHVPHVLRLYRRCDPDVRFFIAADRRSPTEKYDSFCNEIGNATWFLGGATENWKCSELIGWNTIQRRNIATLEALRWGADIICFADDDNAPVDPYYFHAYKAALSEMTQTGWQNRHWSGLLASPEAPWFDIGQFLNPPSSHRGFPHQHVRSQQRLSHVVDAKIGACAGIVLGNPDIAAMTRVVQAPHVLNVSPLLNAGIAVDPRHTWTVFNSQNSAVLREFVPAFFMLPGIGRFDDIFASLIVQRVMRETGHHVLFGQPYVYQERHVHDMQKDIDDEMFGTRHILEFADWLDSLDLGQAPVVNQVKLIFAKMRDLPWMPTQTREAGIAWCEDIERMSEVRP